MVMHMRAAGFCFIAGLTGALPACSTTSSTVPELSDIEACKGARWPVKTGTDSDATQVNTTPQDTTIAQLVALEPPSVTTLVADAFTAHRSAPVETTTYKLTNVTLSSFQLSPDRDITLIVTDGTNEMHVEMPDPSCASGSTFLTEITAVRNTFTSRHQPTSTVTTVNETITVTGVGFFDIPHGQPDKAPNDIELHPVLGLCFDPGCSLSKTVTF
jgi:hypothetical protein